MPTNQHHINQGNSHYIGKTVMLDSLHSESKLEEYLRSKKIFLESYPKNPDMNDFLRIELPYCAETYGINPLPFYPNIKKILKIRKLLQE